MKTFAQISLAILLVACVATIAFILHGPREKETWATLAGLLAVIAAVVAVLPALRILQIQEDAIRPRPTPHFDISSRYNLLQLRVKNLGSGVAYDVKLDWKTQLADHQGNKVMSLDHITVLLPQESASVLLGAAIHTVKAFAGSRFEGECTFKDSTGKKYRDKFICSVDGRQKQLLHDNELPKTLRDLQDIPKELSRIAELLERLKPNE